MIDNKEHGGRIRALAAELKVDSSKILDFSASINPLGPPPGLIETLRNEMETLIRHYPPAGAEYLREALASHLGIDPYNIMIGNGSTELIHLLPRLKREGRALIIEPAFSEYRAGLNSCDWWVDDHICKERALFVPDENDRWTLSAKLKKGYDLVYLGRPANPGGALTDSELVLELAREQEKHGYLVLDQAFVDFCPEESLFDRLAEYPALIIIGSLTKYYAIPGLRLGFLAASKELADRLKGFQPPWSVNILAQEAGRICLAQGDDYSSGIERLVAQERERLTGRLTQLGLKVFPSRANYLLLRLGPGHPSAGELARRLAKDLILVRNCANYKGLSDRYFRISVRLPDENARLIAALEKALGPG